MCVGMCVGVCVGMDIGVCIGESGAGNERNLMQKEKLINSTSELVAPGMHLRGVTLEVNTLQTQNQLDLKPWFVG